MQYPNFWKMEPFLIMDPCYPKHSYSLSIHEMRWDFLQLIHDAEPRRNRSHTCIHTNKSHAKAWAINWFLDGRCKPTILPIFAKLDNITNNGWATTVNKNGPINMIHGHLNILYIMQYISSCNETILCGVCPTLANNSKNSISLDNMISSSHLWD